MPSTLPKLSVTNLQGRPEKQPCIKRRPRIEIRSRESEPLLSPYFQISPVSFAVLRFCHALHGIGDNRVVVDATWRQRDAIREPADREQDHAAETVRRRCPSENTHDSAARAFERKGLF